MLFDLLILLATSAHSELDDAELSLRIREGDKEAFEQFFHSTHQKLIAYLKSRGLSGDEAQDITQQAYLYIWEKREDIDPEKSLRSFLFRIGYTRMLNRFRDTKKFSSDDVEESTFAGSRETQPDSSAEHQDLKKHLQKAIRTLPEKRREVFELCFLQQLSYKEAAEVMEVTPKTIENHMLRAYKDIREKLKGFAD